MPFAGVLAQQVQLQGFEAWQTFGGWIDRTNPRFGYEVAEAFVRGSRIDAAAAAAAREFRAARRTELEPVLTAGTVIAMPTAPWPAPLAGQPRAAMWALRPPLLSLSCIAGTLGAPQVSLPLASVAGLPVGLSLLAAPGADELLLALARTQQS